MTDRKKSLLGHGIIVTALAVQMLLARSPDGLLLAPAIVGPLAGIWAALGHAGERHGSILFALADVALVQVLFWYIIYEVYDLPGKVERGMMVEGFSVFAALLVPGGFILAIIIFGVARLVTKSFAR